jgi:hypothetical protein
MAPRASKKVSGRAFFWGHLITILFHLVISALVIYAGVSGTDNKVLLYTAGGLLAGVSLLSLVPVIKKGAQYEDD